MKKRETNAIAFLDDELQTLVRFVAEHSDSLSDGERWDLEAAIVRLSTFLHFLPEDLAESIIQSTEYYCYSEDGLDDIGTACSVL